MYMVLSDSGVLQYNKNRGCMDTPWYSVAKKEKNHELQGAAYQ